MDTSDLLSKALQARRENRPADAKALLLQAIAINRNGRTLTALGQIERDLQHPEAALALYEEAVAIYRAEGDRLRLAHTVRHVGDILQDEDHLALALPYYEEALAIYRASPDTEPLDLANTLRGFALLREATADKPQARSLWTEAKALYAEVDVKAGVAEATRRLAQL